MVKIENNKLIIEIETKNPVEHLEGIKKAITTVFQRQDKYTYYGGEHQPLYYLGLILESLLLDSEQLRIALTTDISNLKPKEETADELLLRAGWKSIEEKKAKKRSHLTLCK